jgi:hypothetical protein
MTTDPHPLLPDTSATIELVLGVGLIGAGIASTALGVYDDLYYWGILPVRWVMPIAAVIGVVMVIDGVRRFGGPGATFATLGRWLSGRAKWFAAGGVLAAVLGIVVLWEAYAAPQSVRVLGLPDREVSVDIPGPEGYTHRIPAGEEVNFAVERGRHTIVLTIGGTRQEHDVAHDGWPSQTPVEVVPR